MTRFEKEITGILDVEVAIRNNRVNDHFFEKQAKKEVNRCVEQAYDNAIVEEDGAIRWKTGNYIPEDFCEKLEYAGYEFDRKATKIKRDKQTSEYLAEYRERMNNYEYNYEELNEMRNEFGDGATVIDVLTGKEIKL